MNLSVGLPIPYLAISQSSAGKTSFLDNLVGPEVASLLRSRGHGNPFSMDYQFSVNQGLQPGLGGTGLTASSPFLASNTARPQFSSLYLSPQRLGSNWLPAGGHTASADKNVVNMLLQTLKTLLLLAVLGSVIERFKKARN